MFCGNILDQLLNQDCLTNTSSTEQTDLTTLGIWCQKVDNFDTCLQDLNCRFLLFKARRISVDHPVFFIVKRFSTIYCLSENVEQSSQSTVTYRNFDSASCSNYFSVSLKSLAGTQHDASNHIISQMLRNFHNTFFTVVFNFKSIFDIRQISIFKNNIYNRSHDLYDLTFTHSRHFLFWAFAPLQTSVISCVIAA